MREKNMRYVKNVLVNLLKEALYLELFTINSKGLYAAYVRAKQWGKSRKSYKGDGHPRLLVFWRLWKTKIISYTPETDFRISRNELHKQKNMQIPGI